MFNLRALWYLHTRCQVIYVHCFLFYRSLSSFFFYLYWIFFYVNLPYLLAFHFPFLAFIEFTLGVCVCVCVCVNMCIHDWENKTTYKADWNVKQMKEVALRKYMQSNIDCTRVSNKQFHWNSEYYLLYSIILYYLTDTDILLFKVDNILLSKNLKCCAS